MAGAGLTVASVLWMGEFRGRRYGPEWVVRLRNMVARHLDRPHRFVCLSNVVVPGVETIRLRQDWPGWWAKVALFDPAYALGSRVLYLDLDTLIVGDLGGIVDFPADLALAPPAYTFGNGSPKGGAGIVDRYQSSVMVWRPPAGREAFERFGDEARTRFRGDQDWLGHVLPDQPTLPATWFRKLRHCQDGPPEGVKVVLSMPWKNDEAAERFEWVRDTWA